MSVYLTRSCINCSNNDTDKCDECDVEYSCFETFFPCKELTLIELAIMAKQEENKSLLERIHSGK